MFKDSYKRAFDSISPRENLLDEILNSKAKKPPVFKRVSVYAASIAALFVLTSVFAVYPSIVKNHIKNTAADTVSPESTASEKAEKKDEIEIKNKEAISTPSDNDLKNETAESDLETNDNNNINYSDKNTSKSAIAFENRIFSEDNSASDFNYDESGADINTNDADNQSAPLVTSSSSDEKISVNSFYGAAESLDSSETDKNFSESSKKFNPESDFDAVEDSSSSSMPSVAASDKATTSGGSSAPSNELSFPALGTDAVGSFDYNSVSKSGANTKTNGFNNTAKSECLNAQTAKNLALNEISSAYTSYDVYFDASSHIWMVVFHCIDKITNVFLNEYGQTVLITYNT